MLLSRCLSQGQNLTSEFFMTRLGQGSFQDTDPRDEVASVSQPRKPCNLFFWKTGILATTQSVPKLKTVDCRHNTTWQGFLWWCCLALSNKLHGHIVLCFEWHLLEKSCDKASFCPVAGRWGALLAPARSCQLPRARCLVGLADHVTDYHSYLHWRSQGLR